MELHAKSNIINNAKLKSFENPKKGCISRFLRDAFFLDSFENGIGLSNEIVTVTLRASMKWKCRKTSMKIKGQEARFTLMWYGT